MPRPRRARAAAGKQVETLRHEQDTRTNIPTAEYQSLVREEQASPLPVAYQRRNRDLDPQLVWRGKDEQDLADLAVNVPPLYIQEKVHPKALIADLMRTSGQWLVASGQGDDEKELSTNHYPPSTQIGFADFFADFNGLPEGADRTEFYQHDGYWQNRMILGDSLQVMASLSEREGLQGKVQCIYIDPPYGIRFNSNFQWSTTSRDVKDGNRQHITREPEQVKAFRDTWRDGIHSYLTYLRDRLTVARDLLTESGSIFVQIGDENVHRVRAIMDEVFGERNFVRQIVFAKTGSMVSNELGRTSDYLLWYAKSSEKTKYRQLFSEKEPDGFYNLVEMADGSLKRLTSEEMLNPKKFFPNSRVGELVSLESSGSSGKDTPVEFEGEIYRPNRNSHWKLRWPDGMEALKKSGRIVKSGSKIRWKYFIEDYPLKVMSEIWDDTAGFSRDQIYVVETRSKIVERCVLMTTDPGDLVLDPTCGSGTTAYVAEQWGRRWVTIDTSRVALALARARIMGARYPYYILADSKDGQLKEAEITRRAPSEMPTYRNLRQGFVYQRVPHITLRAIANNTEIDVIWEEYEGKLAPLRERLSVASGQWSVAGRDGNSSPSTSHYPLEERERLSVASGQWSVASRDGNSSPSTSHYPPSTSHSSPSTSHYPLEEWEIPRERPEDWPLDTDPLLTDYWTLRIARQKEIDASIAARADYEYLYDKPYEDSSKVRVAGPFTVESISPHRVLGVDENGEVIDQVAEPRNGYGTGYDFGQVILDNLRRSGVQQAHREDRITFTSLTPWPGRFVCASGQYVEGVDSGEWTGDSAGKLTVEGVDSGEWIGDSEGKLTTDHYPLTTERRAAIFIGPEFGTVSRPDLVEAAREAAECGFDVLIACAFNYDAHTTEFESLGRIPVLKARMNADLHMAGELKNTGNGNLFVIFGEPDISVASGQWLVTSGGRMVANYDIVKELSRLGSLEEINGVGGDGLSHLCAVSAGREVRYNRASAALSSVDSGEHSRGGGASGAQGIPEFSGDSQRLAGGDRDVSAAGGSIENGSGGTGQASAGPGLGGGKDAQRTQTLAALQSLKATDFPLTLTTNHWTQATVNGVDVFHPNTGEVRSDGPEGIACWFIDTDYNQESFFVRHAYFLGAGDPYKSLKTTLKAEIDEDAWATLHSATSRPFPKPESGRIAVKVINHLGDEVMKVFRVG